MSLVARGLPEGIVTFRGARELLPPDAGQRLQVIVFQLLAEAERAAGNFDAANAAIDEVERTISEDDITRSAPGLPALRSDLARATGDLSASLDLAVSALAQAQDDDDNGRALSTLGMALAAEGDNAPAARALACGSRFVMHFPLSFSDARARDQAIAALRTALGDAEFDAAWAAGEAMTPEDVLAEVGRPSV